MMLIRLSKEQFFVFRLFYLKQLKGLFLQLLLIHQPVLELQQQRGEHRQHLLLLLHQLVLQ
jgi:hypothetical protein